MLAGLDRKRCSFGVEGMRRCDVDGVDIGGSGQVEIAAKGGFHLMRRRKCLRLSRDREPTASTIIPLAIRSFVKALAMPPSPKMPQRNAVMLPRHLMSAAMKPAIY